MEFDAVGSVLFASKHFVVPDYQRDYAWGKTDVQNLWNDIIELTDENKKDHFLGAIVTSRYDAKDSYLSVIKPSSYHLSDNEVVHLLDGQQRLTSLSMLLAAFKDTVESDEILTEGKIENLIERTDELLFDEDNRNDAGMPSPRLFLKEDSGAYFYQHVLHMAAGGNPDKRYKSIRAIRDHFQLYAELLSKWNTEQNPQNRYNKYCKLINSIKKHLLLVEIKCSENMNEFQVFESLNGKGVNLTAIDRIKNIYLSHARRDGEDGALKWQDFNSELEIPIDSNKLENKLLHFFIAFFFYLDKKRISQLALPDRFKTLANDSYQSFLGLDADLQAAARRYGLIRNAQTSNAATNEILKEIGELGQDQVYVPLYSAASTYGYDGEEFQRIAKILLIYTVRFSVCGKATNTLDGEFAKMIECMRNDNIDDVANYIVSRTENDDDFYNAFRRFSTTSAGFARYLLKKMETSLRIAAGNNNPVPCNPEPTLEHVIPQKINFKDWFGEENIPDKAILDSFKEDYICCIGNMALLNQKNNSKANNKNYAAKRKVYLNGTGRGNPEIPAKTYELIGRLVESYPNRFEMQEVEERAEKMARIAINIWKL